MPIGDETVNAWRPNRTLPHIGSAPTLRDSNGWRTFYRRGLAKLKTGAAAGGEADIARAKAMKPDVAEEFVRRGMR